MNYWLITSYFLLFTSITLYRFHYGLFLLFLFLPTYLIRFNIGPLPTTLLEVMIWILAIIWIIKYKSRIIYHITYNIKKYPTLFVVIGLFLLAATISIFTSANLRAAAGEWKAFYVEPFLIFLILITTINYRPSTNELRAMGYELWGKPLTQIILSALVLCGLVTSIFAIYQHFTGWMVPYAFWENRNTYRVTGWYGFPNAVGLFLAPLVPLALYLVKQSWDILRQTTNNDRRTTTINSITLICSLLFIPCSLLAIIFAKSTGGLIGLTTGIGSLLLIYKKTRWSTIILGVIGLSSILILPKFSGIKQELLFQDRSGQIRVAIYNETIEFLKDNPIFGAGMSSFSQKIIPYHRQVHGENIEIFHHPHNIFLTMYVNIGLLGLLSFILILIWFFKKGLSSSVYHWSQNNKTIFRQTRDKSQQWNSSSIYLLAAFISIITTGLVDSPYIKNDLSIFFWAILALFLLEQGTQKLNTKK